MSNEWFERLVQAIDEHQDSRRAISLRSGLSDTYVHQMITYKKHPSVDRFLAICQAIGKDPVQILTGVERDQETGEAVRLFASMNSEQRAAFLRMLRTLVSNRSKTDEVG